MRKAIFIVLDQYADWEGAYLSSVLNQKDDWEVKTASTEKIVGSIGGFHLKADLLIDEISELPDLLVLIGGNSWTIDNSNLEKLVNNQLESGKDLAAICGAVDYLAKIGALNGHRHTGNAQFFWTDFAEYKNPENFVEAQTIADRNLTTANGTSALDFTELVLKSLEFSDEEIRMAVELHRLGFYKYSEKYGNPFA